MKRQTSFYPKSRDINQTWYLVDVRDKVLGRAASEIASLINGKKMAIKTPGVNSGVYVVVINADQIILTGKKSEQKKYYRHTGYTGGLKTTTFKEMMEKKPIEVLRKAVTGMLPHNKYGSSLENHLKIYASDKHPHEAQNPQTYSIIEKNGVKA